MQERDSVVIVQCDDYAVVYVNGRNVWSAHSIDTDSVLRELNIDYIRYYIEDQDDAEDYDWHAKTFDVRALPDSTDWD